MTELRDLVADVKASFGGGMVPFDGAYWDYLNAGGSPAEAQRLGVYAVLDNLVETWERLNAD